MSQPFVMVAEALRTIEQSQDMFEVQEALLRLVEKYGKMLQLLPAKERIAIYQSIAQGFNQPMVHDADLLECDNPDPLWEFTDALIAAGMPVITVSRLEIDYGTVGEQMFHAFRTQKAPLQWRRLLDISDKPAPLSSVRVQECLMYDGKGEFAIFSLDHPVAVRMRHEAVDIDGAVFGRVTSCVLVPRDFIMLNFDAQTKFEDSYEDHVSVHGVGVLFSRQKLPVDVVPLVFANALRDLHATRQRIFFRSSLAGGVISCCRNV